MNTANVNTNTFGLLYTRPVDDEIYAQPLLVTNVIVPGLGPRNLVVVATVNNSVYAFDADDSSTAAPYWTNSFNSLPNVVPPRNSDMTGACGGDYPNFSGNMGIVSTPVIDPGNGTIYLLSRTKEFGTNFVQKLHSLDVATGLERSNSPVTIAAAIAASGTGSISGVLTFDPQRENQRASLALVNGAVYIAWASHCDWDPYHGWVMAYDAATLHPVAVYNATPSGRRGGIWMSGAAPSADSQGNVYLTVGNGTVDSSGTVNRGESFLRLTLSGTNLNVTSWFTPYNWPSMEYGDYDLGSAGLLLIPGTSLAFSGGKLGSFYLVNRDAMGGLSGSLTEDTNIVQSFTISTNELHGAPVWWDGPAGSFAYFWPTTCSLEQFRFDRVAGRFVVPAFAQSTAVSPNGDPGGILSISASETNSGSGIVWASLPLSGDANPNVRPGILHAYNAENVALELWNSEQLSIRDAVGAFAKFVPPTVANGKVYLATFSSRLNVYGLLPQPMNAGPPVLIRPPAPSNATRFAGVKMTYTAPASGAAPLHWQWFKGTNAVQGATNAAFTLTGLKLSDTATYACRVTNSLGTTNTPMVSLNVIAAPSTPYPVAVLADAPMAYWRLDEPVGSGIAHDYVGGFDGGYSNVTNGLAGYNLLETNAAIGVGPAFNPAWTRDSAVAGIVGIDFSSQGANAAFSVEAWVKQNAPSSLNGIVALGDGRGGEQFCLDAPGGNFRFYIREGVTYEASMAQGSVGNDTRWHHVVGTLDQAAARLLLYVDGTLAASNAAPSGLGVQAATWPLSIGARESGWVTGNDAQLNAAIDEVAIYDYSLTSAQVQHHYAAGTNAFPVPLAFALSGHQLQLSWPAGVLQAAPQLAGSYTNVTGALSPFLLNPSNVQVFYRVQIR